MREKTDARVLKTKAKLVDTFMQMIAERDFESLTVNDICIRADIRRATFYKHFDDKNDFFKYIVDTLRDKFDEEWTKIIKGNPDEYFSYYAISLIDFFDENSEVMKKLCGSTISTAVLTIALSQNFKETITRLENAKEAGVKIVHSIDILSAFLVGGVFHTLRSWVMSDKKIPKEQLKIELKAIIDHLE